MTHAGDSDLAPTTPHSDAVPGGIPRALPTRIGHYHIKRLLGLGGMGTVYEAVQEHPHRTVALKVMKRGVASGSALRRFEYEAQLLARLRHPGIAQVYEAGTHEDCGEQVPFFAMEYVPAARYLTQYADEEKLGTRQRLALFARVCEAVEHGHQHGIVHRDLKPGNILVDGSGQPKIIDFGVARATDSDLVLTTLQTDLGEMIGTLPYMSPEQCVGDPHDLDARSDVYSLGVVLYELLTGRLPYDLTKVAMLEAARRIREQPPARPSTINRALRGDVETMALKALEKERARRYPSAAALGEDLRRYLGGDPIDARRDSPAYVTWTLVKAGVSRHPVLSFLMAGAASVLIAHYAVVPWLFAYWTWPSRVFERAAARVLPVPTVAPGMENVRIIAIRDGVDFDALAAGEGLEGVSASNWPSMRRLHGRLMDKLARAGVRAVAWDVMFRRRSDFDADFVKGVERLSQSGAGAVVAVPNWRVDDLGLPIRGEDDPGLSVEIGAARGLRWGSASIGEGEFVVPELALERAPAPPMASFVVEAYAAWRCPTAEPVFRIDPRANVLNIAYLRRHPTVARAWKLAGGPDVIPLASLTNRPTPAPDVGIEADDLVGRSPVLVPEAAAFAPYTRGYEEVSTASDAELRNWYEGKLALVGDMRPGADEHRIPDGRQVFGVHVTAAALGAILAGRAFRLPNEGESVALTALAVACGLAATGPTAWRWYWRALVLLAVAVMALGLDLALFRGAHVIVNPLIPLVSIVLGASLGGALNFMRGRSESR